MQQKHLDCWLKHLSPPLISNPMPLSPFPILSFVSSNGHNNQRRNLYFLFATITLNRCTQRSQPSPSKIKLKSLYNVHHIYILALKVIKSLPPSDHINKTRSQSIRTIPSSSSLHSFLTVSENEKKIIKKISKKNVTYLSEQKTGNCSPRSSTSVNNKIATNSLLLLLPLLCLELLCSRAKTYFSTRKVTYHPKTKKNLTTWQIFALKLFLCTFFYSQF